MRAIFLDKDGTLIDDLPYNVDPRLMTLTRGAGPALQRLQRAGFALVVVSNQPGIARGLFDERAMCDVRSGLTQLLNGFDVRLDGFYYCPHCPNGSVHPYAAHCDCRKPKPGMLQRAAHERGIDLGMSWMIGDILDDVEAGARAGCHTALVDNGNETEWVLSDFRTPELRAPDLYSLAVQIQTIAC